VIFADAIDRGTAVVVAGGVQAGRTRDLVQNEAGSRCRRLFHGVRVRERPRKINHLFSLIPAWFKKGTGIVVRCNRRAVVATTWFKTGSGIVVRSTLRAVLATVPNLVLNRASENFSRIPAFIAFFQVRERTKTQLALALVEGTRVVAGRAGPKSEPSEPKRALVLQLRGDALVLRQS
jgi:hypothetical protein